MAPRRSIVTAPRKPALRAPSLFSAPRKSPLSSTPPPRVIVSNPRASVPSRPTKAPTVAATFPAQAPARRNTIAQQPRQFAPPGASGLLGYGASTGLSFVPSYLNGKRQNTGNSYADAAVMLGQSYFATSAAADAASSIAASTAGALSNVLSNPVNLAIVGAIVVGGVVLLRR